MKRIFFIVAVLMLATAPLLATTRVSDFRWNNTNLLRQDGDLHNWAKWVEGMVGGGQLGTGNIFYVDSNVTYEGDGTSWATAKDTLNEAVDLCTADNGDVIFVAQGHREAMGAAADEVDVDIDGVTIIGCGNDKLRPLFDYTGDVTGAFAVGADNVTIINLQFCANVTDVNEAIEIEAGSTGVTIAGCLFWCNAEGTDEFKLACIDSKGAASDRLTIAGCEFNMGAGAAETAIHMLDSDYFKILDNIIVGDYSQACIENETTASNHALIRGNILFNGTIGGNAGLNTEPAIEMVATTSGIIADNYIVCNLAAFADSIVAPDMFLFQNYISEDESSAATGALIGTASAP
jgi:hypothetical protein